MRRLGVCSPLGPAVTTRSTRTALPRGRQAAASDWKSQTTAAAPTATHGQEQKAQSDPHRIQRYRMSPMAPSRRSFTLVRAEAMILAVDDDDGTIPSLVDRA